MFNIKLVIAYFGSPYVGWQKTKMGPSIEEVLEQTLEKILQHEIKLQAASRTDAGVHAKGQIVNFFLQKPLSLSRLQQSLNGLLPKEISVTSIEKMHDDFHPTLDCVKKEYWYHLCNSSVQMPFYRDTSWHFPYALDHSLMQKAADQLIGTYDFSAFCNQRKLWDRSPICSLEKIVISPLPEKRLRIEITADHFLYNMARNIAGTLTYVGCGKLKSGDIPAILKTQDRTLAGMTAPACGLLLKEAYYE